MDILLVEDEVQMQQHLKDTFEYFFGHVHVANDGLEALKILKSQRVDALFTDYEMPNFSGYELIKEIRTNNKKIPITIISDHDEKDILLSCISLGLSGYLLKPLKYEVLKKFLENFAHELEKNGTLKHRFSTQHCLNIATNTLKNNTTLHVLTKMEIRFLQLMISNIGEIVSFEKMDDTLFEFEVSHNSIKNLIYRLKKKYDFNYIKNVKNVGYILVQDN